MKLLNNTINDLSNSVNQKKALYGKLAMSDEDINSMIDDFLKSFRTDAAQQRNQIMAEGARNDLPSDVLNADLRGAEINNAKAQQSGFNQLKLAGKNSQMDAARFLAQLNFQREMAKMQVEAQKDSALINAFSSAAFGLPFLLKNKPKTNG